MDKRFTSSWDIFTQNRSNAEANDKTVFQTGNSMSALPSLQGRSLACWLAFLILHGAGHTGHAGAERILAWATLGLWSFEVAARRSVVLGASFGGQACTLGNRQLLAATHR
jgi:hypothetical protein